MFVSERERKRERKGVRERKGKRKKGSKRKKERKQEREIMESTEEEKKIHTLFLFQYMYLILLFYHDMFEDLIH